MQNTTAAGGGGVDPVFTSRRIPFPSQKQKQHRSSPERKGRYKRAHDLLQKEISNTQLAKLAREIVTQPGANGRMHLRQCSILAGEISKVLGISRTNLGSYRRERTSDLARDCREDRTEQTTYSTFVVHPLAKHTAAARGGNAWGDRRLNGPWRLKDRVTTHRRSTNPKRSCGGVMVAMVCVLHVDVEC